MWKTNLKYQNLSAWPQKYSKFYKCFYCLSGTFGQAGIWHISESACLASTKLWLGFIPAQCHMWVVFVVGFHLSLRVFLASGFFGFSPSQKPTSAKFNSATGMDLGGGCRRYAPLPEMKLSLYLLLKFVYLTHQWRHSLEVHPLLRKILDLPLSQDKERAWKPAKTGVA